MAQLKAHEVDSWLRRPPPTPVVLIYGPDRGLVSERAGAYARASGLPLDDPFSVVRFDAGADDEAGGLIDEARTFSMFSDRRLIWVRNAAAQKHLVEDVKALCREPPAGAAVLIEAGDLKKGAALRTVVEGSENAIALPCYADADRDLDRLIDDELSQAGVGIDPGARALLRGRLGGDRLATRSELQKLALYAADDRMITARHVTDLSGDVSDLSVNEIVDAVLAGDLAGFDRDFARYAAAGGQLFLVLNGAMRELQWMRPLRHEIESRRRDAGQLVASARPPVHFSRRRQVEAALRAWTLEAIDRALPRLQAAVLETRLKADIAQPLAHRTLLALAAEASRRTRSSATY